MYSPKLVISDLCSFRSHCYQTNILVSDLYSLRLQVINNKNLNYFDVQTYAQKFDFYKIGTNIHILAYLESLVY